MRNNDIITETNNNKVSCYKDTDDRNIIHIYSIKPKFRVGDILVFVNPPKCECVCSCCFIRVLDVFYSITTSSWCYDTKLLSCTHLATVYRTLKEHTLRTLTDAEKLKYIAQYM